MEIVLISATFTGSIKPYSFKAAKGMFQPGDEAIVETANGPAVVTVGKELPDYQPVPGVRYRFAFQKVDCALLSELEAS